MEKTLADNVATIMAKNQASGVAVTDKDGIPLYTTGVTHDMANIASLLMADAKSMFPKGTRNKKNSFPIITLQGSDGSKTTIANKHGETLTIHYEK